MRRLDIGAVAPPEEKPAQVIDCGDGTWKVMVLEDWHATWDSEEGAREHARRINDAIEWSSW